MARSRLIYLGLLIGAFVFSQALYDSISLFTLALVLVIPLFSLLCLGISMLLVRVEAEEPPASKRRLERFFLRLKIHSRTPLMLPMVKLRFKVNAPLGDRAVSGQSVVHYAAFGTTELEIPVEFQVRGLYEIGVESVIFYDFLRLFSIRKKINKVAPVVIGPRDLALDIPVHTANQEQEDTVVSGGQETRRIGDLAGIREFNENDTLRRVHWKLSARLSKMIVKTYWENSCDNIVILADLFAHEADRRQNRRLVDCVVEIARRVSYDLTEQGARSTLAYPTPAETLHTQSIGNFAEHMLADDAFRMTPMMDFGNIHEAMRELDLSALQEGALYVISSLEGKQIFETVRQELEGVNCRIEFLVVRPEPEAEYGTAMKMMTLAELEEAYADENL